MTDLFSHLSVDARKVVLEPVDVRVAYMREPRWVPHPPADAALRRLGDLIAEPKSAKCSGLLLHGPGDTGISTILQRACETFAEGRRSPAAAMITLPPGHNERRLMLSILAALRYPMIWRCDLWRLQAHVSAALLDSETRLLVVDNLHDAHDVSKGSARKCLALLRAIAERGQVGLAFGGVDRTKDVLKLDAQLAARTQVMRLGAWPQQRWVVDVIGQAVRELPLRFETVIDGELLDIVFSQTGGLPGRTFRHLRRAGIVAAETGVEKLTPKLLRSQAVTVHLRTLSRKGDEGEAA